MILKQVQAGFGQAVVLQAFVRPSCKTGWAVNEEAVVVKFAMPCTTDFFFLLDKARLIEINSGNKSVVTVIPLIFLFCQ